jgi:hypothetical protein
MRNANICFQWLPFGNYWLPLVTTGLILPMADKNLFTVLRLPIIPLVNNSTSSRLAIGTNTIFTTGKTVNASNNRQKGYRSVFTEASKVYKYLLNEIRINSSGYACKFCVNKLNRILKLDEDI